MSTLSCNQYLKIKIINKTLKKYEFNKSLTFHLKVIQIWLSCLACLTPLLYITRLFSMEIIGFGINGHFDVNPYQISQLLVRLGEDRLG
jgi:hypothetical protein